MWIESENETEATSLTVAGRIDRWSEGWSGMRAEADQEDEFDDFDEEDFDDEFDDDFEEEEDDFDYGDAGLDEDVDDTEAESADEGEVVFGEDEEEE